MFTLPFPVLILVTAAFYLFSIHFLLRVLHNRSLLRRP